MVTMWTKPALLIWLETTAVVSFCGSHPPSTNLTPIALNKYWRITIDVIIVDYFIFVLVFVDHDEFLIAVVFISV